MELVSRSEGDTQVILVDAPRIDAAVAVTFKEAMRKVMDPDSTRMVLDLMHVDFIDSSGLGAVVAVRKLIGNGQSLELAGLTPIVSKVFRLTRMDQVFAIHDSVDAAVMSHTD